MADKVVNVGGAYLLAEQTTYDDNGTVRDAQLLKTASEGGPQEVWSAGFSGVGATLLDARFGPQRVGTGVTANQTAGALNILTGTTPNSEFFARSLRSFRGSMRLRFSLVASQRIANNNFAVLLADLIADNAAYNIINTTTVDVTATAHGFDATMIGQSALLGGITGAAGIPGRYAIASIPNADTLRFTVAGWPASGTGTLTAFGRNYVRNLVTGTTATNINFDAQRNGWATGDTVGTTLTTASPGLLVANELTGRDVFFYDSLRASTGTPNFVARASRYENIPDANTPLYVFLWSFNGTVAPASTTTFTLSHVAVEEFANVPVYIQGIRANGAVNPLAVSQQGALTIGTLPATPAGTNTIGNVNLHTPVTVNDIVSAAITSTATTAAISPLAGTSYKVQIPVTAVSGTTPTMDVSIEESLDGGTNWFKVYDFPRITAVGSYSSPKLPQTGNRVRYVQTIGGTTPSFTRAINRIQSSDTMPALRQSIDRAISLTTLNAAMTALDAAECNNVQLIIELGTATTPPTIQLEGSDSLGGTGQWYPIGTALLGVASSTVQVTVPNVQANRVRARVSVVGATIGAGYSITLKAF